MYRKGRHNTFMMRQIFDGDVAAWGGVTGFCFKYWKDQFYPVLCVCVCVYMCF